MRATKNKLQASIVWFVTLATLGSGIVNLWSVATPPLPERLRILRGIFPIEFLHISNFLTMIFGFTLIVSSLNIFRRKRRAFKIVLALTLLSIVFNLTKGLDYEEATLSAALTTLLLLTRKSFKVSSRAVPGARDIALRAVVGAVVAGAYTLMGYRHLYAISATFAVYVLVLLYRPVRYRFNTQPLERIKAAEILKRHSRGTQDFFKVWPDKSFFFSRTGNSFLAYRVGNNFAVVLGDPVGPGEELEGIIKGFSEHCRLNGWRLAFHQATPETLQVYRGLGFRHLKVGDDAIVDLTAFSLEGKARKDIRTKFNQFEKAGIHVVRYEPPVSEQRLREIKEVSDEWLQIPGRRERRFTLGVFDEKYLRSVTILAAVDAGGRMLAFVNLVPTYKEGEGTIDLMRRRRDAPNGVMDYLFGKVLLELKSEGYQRFNMGMAPMAGFQKDESASTEEKLLHHLFQKLNFLFSFSGLKVYKAKFASSWEPRYVIYNRLTDLPRMALALEKVSSIKDGM